MSGHLLFDSWCIVGVMAAGLTLPGTLELFTLTAAALLPRSLLLPKSPASVSAARAWRLAVVVPAHNEQASISVCLQSLLRAERGSMHVVVYVVADNCTDNTALLAEAAGATVLRRSNMAECGKGYALRFAFDHLESLDYDGVLVVDADTEVSENFLVAASEPMRRGAAAIQVRYLIRSSTANTRIRLMGVGFRAFNGLRPLGREHLHLSAGILGNGFGLRRETLQAVPYVASSIVEDLEYHLLLVKSGLRVTFVNDTTVFGEAPARSKGAKTQRSRWEGGRMRMLINNGPVFLRDSLRGRVRCVEPLFDLLLLPLAYHFLLLVAACLAPIHAVRVLGAAGLLVMVLHLCATLIVTHATWRDAAALVIAPFYILWKLTLVPALFRNARANQTWLRTERNAETSPEFRR